jgi:hypothetical protein
MAKARSSTEPSMRVAPGSRRQVRLKRTKPPAGAVKCNSSRFQSGLESQDAEAAKSMSVRPSNTPQRKPLAAGSADVWYSKRKL